MRLCFHRCVSAQGGGGEKGEGGYPGQDQDRVPQPLTHPPHPTPALHPPQHHPIPLPPPGPRLGTPFPHPIPPARTRTGYPTAPTMSQRPGPGQSTHPHPHPSRKCHGYSAGGASLAFSRRRTFLFMNYFHFTRIIIFRRNDMQGKDEVIKTYHRRCIPSPVSQIL